MIAPDKIIRKFDIYDDQLYTQLKSDIQNWLHLNYKSYHVSLLFIKYIFTTTINNNTIIETDS